MNMLIAAAAVFLGIHLLIAGTRLRNAIVRGIGESVYLGLFSLASIAAISWLVIAFRGAPYVPLYDLGQGVHDMGVIVVLIAFFIGVQGLMMPNPTSLKQEATAAKAGTIHGVLRITRHPFLWGVAIWAAFHLAANGDEASVILFGTFLALAIFGTFSIDAKRKRKMGDAWKAFAAKTSNIPFAAALTGRNKLNLAESFGWRFWLTLAIFAGALYVHAHYFPQHSPLPPNVPI
jgi:uncharacterized membrane protein